MKKNFYSVFNISAVLIILFAGVSCSNTDSEALATKTKVMLRAVGNDLLLSQKDTTSLILPVVQVDENSYLLSFEKPVSFDPNTLYGTMSENTAKANLPSSYSVEVLRCIDGEVGYSYLLTGDIKEDIIPCGGRLLPESCYTIQFKYLEATAASSSPSIAFYILVFLVFAFLVLVFYSKYHAYRNEEHTDNVTTLGDFFFYPEQHKLLTPEREIALSKKECELLEILASNMNQVVKRETLTKQVWEDQGVIVGRSLDTYISKLRKKLQGDASLKITNIHGVGYSLETDK